MTINSLLFLLTIAAIVALFVQNARINARAVHAAQQLCQQHGLQLLDQSVVLTSLKLASYRGMPCLMRQFRFEFANKGDRRYQGWVTFKAWVLHATELQPYADNNLH